MSSLPAPSRPSSFWMGAALSGLGLLALGSYLLVAGCHLGDSYHFDIGSSIFAALRKTPERDTFTPTCAAARSTAARATCHCRSSSMPPRPPRPANT